MQSLLRFLVSTAPLTHPSKPIKNLVTFGDSYTDVANPVDQGASWPTYAASYAGVSLFPFAINGATCSNKTAILPSRSVLESQLPTYFNETLHLDPAETLYTLWIGTNDVGPGSLLTGGNNASIIDGSHCMIDWVIFLYESGARNFLIQNMNPLQYVPMYSPHAYLSKYWNLLHNTTEWNLAITQLTLSGNKITKLLLQVLAPQLRGAHVGLFDSHSLFLDMLAHPANYLNGTAPLNTTGAVLSCVFQPGASTGDCTEVNGTARDSYLWWDELHPSEQADRMLARNIAEVIEGKENKWTTWLS